MKTKITSKSGTAVARKLRTGATVKHASTRVNARFDADTAAKLNQVTTGDGISVSEALKRAIGMLHAQFRIGRPHKTRRPILESMIGKYSSGLGDLAENRKSYYAQAMAEKYSHR